MSYNCMASIRKVPRSPYWIARFRDLQGKQFSRSTKLTDKAAARVIADKMEMAARDEMTPVEIALMKLRRCLLARGGL